jgi:tetratricopeptide (TPR) repeat protein
MHKLLRYRNCKDQLSRQIAIIVTLRRVLLLTVCIFGVIPSYQTLAQSKSVGTGASSLCKRSDAIEMIRQQIDVTRTFDNAVRRITVLIRAADLLWPLQQDKARAAFTEGFELAVQNEKEKSEQSKDRPRALILSMQTPDQRYVVIRAVAKRDTAWAKKLAEQVLKLDRQSDEQASTKDSFNDVLTAQRLLDSANQLISTDINAAVDLARASLNYPATFMMTNFLYKLAEVNQQAADQFYDQALVVYADRPMREFLYLLGYPFAFPDSNNMPVSGSYVVPRNFVTNYSLQRRFVQTLLRRAQQALEVPLDEGDNFNELPGTGHILQVLMRIEPQVKALLPDLSEAVVQAREKILVSLPVETQKAFLQPGRNEVSGSPEKTFDEQIETAEQTPNVNNRDDLIASAVLGAGSDQESLAGVVDAIDKITDSSIRSALLELLYFRRAKDAANGKRFDEAERLASKVEGREQRAFLHTEIAKALLNSSETQTHAREVLEEAITEANKAGTTIFVARTLLTASNLYAKIDLSRSISVLGDAINCINHIEAPDFSVGDQTLVKEIKRKSNAGRFLIRFYMPGLDPENAFRAMAKIEFDDTLSQTTAFTDKFLRATTTLAVADVCLQQAQPKEKPKKSAKP